MILDILIISDSLELLNSTSKILSTLGHNIKKLEDLNQVEEYIKDTSPLCIVMIISKDYSIFFNKVKSLESHIYYKHIPIIVIAEKEYKAKDQYLKYKNVHSYTYLPMKNVILKFQINNLINNREKLKISLDQPIDLKAQLKGEIVAINEISVFLNSSIKLNPNQQISLNSKYIQEKLKIQNSMLRIFIESKYLKKNTYQTELVFIAVVEKNTKKIRSIRSQGKN